MSRIQLQDNLDWPEDERLDSARQVSHSEPLLDDHPDEPIPEISSSSRPYSNAFAYFSQLRGPRSWQVTEPFSIVMVVAFIKFSVITSALLMLMPIYRLLEDAFCHVHFEDNSPGLIDEMKCKIPEVQSPLAYLLGWFGMTGSVMNLIVTYPYGMLADRIGRKPTAMLSYSGVALSFSLCPLMLGPGRYIMRENPYLMLFGCLWNLVGGGIPVLLNTLYAIAADVSTEETKATNFLYLTMGVSSGGLLGPFIAGVLMSRFDPWMPIIVVLCLIPVNFALFMLVPETLTVNAKPQNGEGEAPPTMKQHILHGLRDLRNSLQMLRKTNIPLCLVTFFFGQARFVAGSSTLTQYISKNFGWTFAETSILLSPLGVVNIIVLALLPKLSAVLTSPRFGFTPFGKDLYLAKLSLVALIASAFLRAISPNITLFLFGLFINCLGAAEMALVRAVVSTFVEPSHTSRLFALIGMVEVMGAFAGGPVLAWCFERGMQWQGIWTGLPWLYLGFTCVLCWAALVFVKPPSRDWDGDDVFGGDEEGESRPSHPVRLD